MHFLYQFSLQFFLDIYHSLMVDPKLEEIKEPTARLAVITQNLYSTCYERVTRGVLHQVREKTFLEEFLILCQNRIVWFSPSSLQGFI